MSSEQAMKVVELLRKSGEAKKEKQRLQSLCKHNWKSRYDFVYDYDHQDCTKCGAYRMV